MSAAPRQLPSLRDFRSALIVKPSSLGDIVHTLPAVKALRDAHPRLKIRWLANTEWTPILQGSPLLDEVIPFPRKTFRGLAGLARFWVWRRTWMTLPREEPEIVLDFQGLMRSGLVSSWRGSKTVVGLSDAREGSRFFYNHTVPVDAGAHAVDRYLELPRALGIKIEAEDIAFELAPGSAPIGWTQPAQSFVAVHPWSRGEGKSLSNSALQALCDALAPHPVVLVGMTSDPTRPTGTHIQDWSQRTSLPELIWIMRQAKYCVSVDSGPMHIAAAVNPQTLGIHTWSDPRKVGPYPSKVHVWKAGRIAARTEFSAEECQREANVTEADARGMGEWVGQRL
ncbi:glycosyltransferase family 9 protein [Prosthecobacter vanneervenii]|uniref:ADP-heptose:LPS heptosyltransferase n=1 Tax=Prosthecobacter vanneervenii TaxID=48466 RepID=A0A7W7YFC2_9BACT|nr:glycosyltransferase family 9 protein [Prosthecobacter vanneervenii]MBB5035137.1 ADP-heptose:LPS heptosyltransferase [Prosthecobacter vanneervenii]